MFTSACLSTVLDGAFACACACLSLQFCVEFFCTSTVQLVCSQHSIADDQNLTLGFCYQSSLDVIFHSAPANAACHFSHEKAS
jgi:hypothetical protein